VIDHVVVVAAGRQCRSSASQSPLKLISCRALKRRPKYARGGGENATARSAYKAKSASRGALKIFSRSDRGADNAGLNNI
jgi:hypothetical protein